MNIFMIVSQPTNLNTNLTCDLGTYLPIKLSVGTYLAKEPCKGCLKIKKYSTLV